MGYYPIPPKKTYSGRPGARGQSEPYRCAGGRPRTDAGNYRKVLNDVFKGLPHRISLYDIDLVLEVDGTFRHIFEFKEFSKSYKDTYVPFFEYVALKKVAKKLQVPPYVIVEQKGEYRVFPVDRFETVNDREYRMLNDRKHAVFQEREGIQLNRDQFVEWFRQLAQGETA